MKWKAESYRSIRSVDLFSDSVIEKLESLHIETIEDLVALTQIESGPELLSAGLGYEPESFGSLMGLARGMCDTSQGGLLGSLGKEHLDEMPFACLQPTQAMMQDLKQRYGGIDFLINNAAILRDRTVAKMSLDEWKSALDVNLSGVFHCCKFGLEVMRDGGAIVSMGSIAAL